MFFETISMLSEVVLFASCLFILFGSIFLTYKTRFIQLRFFPALFRMIKNASRQEGSHTVPPYKALMAAMSTTIGLGTIVGPFIAIHLGGPGALLGFLLTSFFGSAATYAEVTLCIQHRKKLASGVIMGGPMHYLTHIFSSGAAKWYALSCLVLMTVWSGAQANQLSSILDSPLLGAYRTPTIISGSLIAIMVVLILVGGIKRIGAFASKIVPVMFVMYIGSSFWIIGANIDKLGSIMSDMFVSFFSPYAMASGTLVGGVMSALRWGIFKGVQTNEAGIGTQTIPHSMAETNDASAQGMLAMVSTYTAGLIAFISGCVALITDTWQDPALPLGMSMVAASFEYYFASLGIVIVALSTFLFAFTTILGNSYNGSQCFGYLTNNRGVRYYFMAAAIMIFLGAISDTKTVWSLIDIVLAFMALPHMAALMYYAHKKPEEILAIGDPIQANAECLTQNA